MTSSLKQALAFLNDRVLDHFIVAGNKTMRFAERGLIGGTTKMNAYTLLIIIFAWIAFFIYIFFRGKDDDN